MDPVRAGLRRLAAVNQRLAVNYPVLYPTLRVMAIFLISQRLLRFVSFLFLLHKSATSHVCVYVADSCSTACVLILQCRAVH